jgi:hypothetical protein
MNVKETFLNLTKHTVPYGKELSYLKDLLPMDILKKDPGGNLFINIGQSTTMFTSHLDTVGGDKDITHVIKDNIIRSDGKSILGADDKAGVVIMLYMIEQKIPGLYQFFLGEEVGCKGSRALVSWLEKNKDNKIYKNINKVISFDRKDVDSVITYQSGERCCSDDFADSLISELGKYGLSYKKDTGGVLTDSIHFTDLYAECTNLSVGYWSQHTNSERQDIDFLEKLCIASSKIDWESLKISRKPGESERLYRSYSNYSGYDYNDGYDDWYGGGNYSRSSNNWSYSNRNSNSRNSNSRTNTSEYVTDWNGNNILSSNAVWCEFDNEWCSKDEAIWVELLGFYTTPDESVKQTIKTNTNNTNDNEIIKDGNDLMISEIIEHPLFGKGTVKKISPDKKKVIVKFYDNSEKQLLISVAKIKRA